jgi:hypothetical protein
VRFTKDSPPGFWPAFASREAWEIRAAHLRRRTAIALGLANMPERPRVVASVHGKTFRDGYSVEKVFFASMPGLYVTGNLYRPANPRAARLPIVLHPYGHWPDGRFIWMSDENIDAAIANGSEVLRSSARSPLQACNATFARMGCVVFQYDMLGYCDSKAFTHPRGFDDVEAILRSQGLMGLQTFNSIRALDFVSSLPDVDAEHVAVGGASSGGTQTLMLGVMDDRPKAMFIAGMIGMNMQGGCACENAPLLRLESNNVELCATLAPRPVFCSGATGDWTHDSDVRGLPELKHIYKLYDAVDRVDGNVLKWPHNFNAHTRADFYAFVDRVFGLDSGDAQVEREFDPIPPAGLSVFDEHHPRPGDEATIESIRQNWRPSVSAKELLQTWIGDVEPAAIEMEREEVVTIELRNVSRTSGTCVIQSRAGGPRHEIKLPGLEPITLTKDKPAWFDYVFNRPAIIERARQIIAIAEGVRATSPPPLTLVADAMSSPLAWVVCAARPGLFTSASVVPDGFDFDQIVSMDDDRLIPGALACGGIEAMIRASRSTGH